MRDFWKYLLLAFFCFLIFSVTHGGTGYEQYGLLVFFGTGMFALIAFYLSLKNNFYFTYGQIGILFILVILMSIPALTGIINMGSSVGVNFLIMNTITLLVFISIMNYKNLNGVDFITSLFIGVAFVISLMSIFIFFYPIEIFGVQFGREGYFRLVGTFSTPNRFGELPAVGVLASTYYFLKYPNNRKRYTLLIIFFLLFSVGAGSKGVLLGLLVGIAVFLLNTRMIFKSTLWKSVFLLTPLLLVVAILMIDYIILALKLDQIMTGQIDAGAGRGEIWDIGQNIYMSNPLFLQLFGFGATGFISNVGLDAHSMYWNLLFDYGIFPIVSVIILLIYIGIRIIAFGKNQLEFIFATSLILFCLVRGISIATILNSYNMSMIAFWAGMAIIVSHKNNHFDKKKSYARPSSIRGDVSLQGSGTIT